MKKKTKQITLIIGVFVSVMLLNYCKPSSNTNNSDAINTFKNNETNENQTKDNTMTDNLNTENVTIAFYNVENLFDIYDDPKTFDEDFTPDGEKKWDLERYQAKLRAISTVISNLDTEHGAPALVGLAEVENYDVLKDLISTGKLKNKHYKIVHGNNHDSRGIDVAAIYRSDIFEKIDYTYYNVPDLHTRDILHITGKLLNQDIVHYFITHWPSRRKGTEESEYKRIEVADILRREIDNIFTKDKNSKIIIMGDFNDEPSNNSIKNHLVKDDMHNLFAKKQQGTVNHRGDWLLFDQFIVSNALMHDKNYILSNNSGHIYNDQSITFTHKDGNTTPSRTYGGPKYYGGTSDHYAVYLKIKVKY